MQEEALIASCRTGNTKAFERLVTLYEKKVFNLAFRMTGSLEDARDITQDAFIKVYTSLRDFRGDSAFSTWLFRIVSNMCLDELRRRRRRTFMSIDEPIQQSDGEIPRQLADPLADPEQAVERRDLKRAVHEAILNLSEDHRLIIVLRDLQGFTYEEIASMLDCSLGTVKSRLNRARMALRKALQDKELFATGDVKTGERGVGR
ncbi:MAG: sigma-70 family RNA polymerase sigma factor [Bacillota bacterium]